MAAAQVLAQQHQPRRFLAPSHPRFYADDGFDSNPQRSLVELDEGEQVTQSTPAIRRASDMELFQT
jgi:hypothetical protein